MALRALVFLFALLLSGCGDSLTKLVNSRFPPVNEEQQRQTAIDTTANALSKLSAPNVALGLVLTDAQQILFGERLKEQGVTKLDIEADKQLLKIEIAFDRQFGAGDAGSDQNVTALLEALKPHVVGRVTAYAGLTGAVVTAGKEIPELELRILPSISAIEVDKIEVAQKRDVKTAADGVVALLNKYKDNLSGELSRSQLTTATIPAMTDKPLNLGTTIEVHSPEVAAKAVITANPIIVPFKVDGIAWLLSSGHMKALVQLSPVAVVAPPPPVQIEHTYAAISARFNDIVGQVMGVVDADTKTWVAIKKDVLALAANSAFAQAGACVTASVSAQNQHVSKKIALPNGLGIDCTPTQDCSPTRQCSYDPDHDTTDCGNRCYAWAPRICFFNNCSGGQCIQRGNDPICEGLKFTNNERYEAEAAGRKSDCERIKKQESIACETDKAQTRLVCESKKELLNRLAATGNFAKLDVDSSVSTDNLKVCMQDFALSPNLDHVKFALDVQGDAKATVNVNFVPLDIVGHLTCQFPWSKAQDFIASLRQSRVGIEANVNLVTDQTDAHADFIVDKTDIEAHLSPGPTEVLLRSPDLMLKCPVLAMVAPTVVSLTPFVPQLRGDIDYTLKEQKASFKLPLPKQTVANHPVTVMVTSTKTSLIATATLSSATKTATK
ncbi:UNVERIFIED_ORG: hypothetical protein BDU10_2527 [Burkholderia sp. CF145]